MQLSTPLQYDGNPRATADQVAELEQAQGRIAEQIRAAVRHKRAGTAYAGAGQQP